MAWPQTSGYNKRAGVESHMACWKGILGKALRFHIDQAQATEVAVGVAILNRMLDLEPQIPSASSDHHWGWSNLLPSQPPCNSPLGA